MIKILVKLVIAICVVSSSFNSFAHGQKTADEGNNLSQDSLNLNQKLSFDFIFPEIELIDQNNQPRILNKLFDKERNVVFAFFFSHCVSVCSTITLSLKSILPDLPPDTLIAMISIDPDTDTPDLLNAYAKQFQISDPNWYLLTGDSKNIIDLQKSFEAYRGNKMNHSTSLFLKKTGSEVITEIKTNFSEIPKLLLEES